MQSFDDRSPSALARRSWFPHAAGGHADQEATTIVDILRWRAGHQPEKLSHIFLADGERDEIRVTYGELDRQARAIAAALEARCAPGARALLLYPAGLEFIAAFFGCLYAGIVAVPAYPPRNRSHMPRIGAIMADSGARLALTTARTLAGIQSNLDAYPDLAGLQWMATDETDLARASAWRAPAPASDRLAFLQYTSGSTGRPKGVMVSHANILYDSLYIQRSFSLHPASVSTSWLPSFHDMGLIDGVIQPLYTGFLGVILSPVSFIQKPFRWLDAVSRYRATHCGSPNFGYDLCTQKITPEQRATLDLRCWESAYNGAEPVRKDTLLRFSEAFREAGFSLRTFYPCYGMAETTLMVSGGHVTTEPVFCRVDKPALEQGMVRESDSPAPDQAVDLVGSGRMILGTDVRIVDHETGRLSLPDRVGEVWISAPSVCLGYWQRPDETAATFHATLAETGEGPFLRTGDLGFIRDGELFITGRLKDLIIIRGRNLYPQDIEATAERAHPALRLGGNAAFAVDLDGEERLILVQELERTALKTADVDGIVRAVTQAVAEEHEAPLHEIVLIKTSTIAKTSSGKIQRRTCRARYLNGELEVVARWKDRAPAPETAPAPARATPAAPLAPAAAAIAAWLTTRIAALAKRPADRIEPQAPFSSFGLDSVTIVGLSGDLSAFVGRDLPPTLLYDFPSIERLSRRLAGDAGAGPAEAAARPAGRREPIAIIGIGCRLPGGAHGPDAFWRLLREGADAIGAVPPDRWDAAALEAAAGGPGEARVRLGGFVDEVDRFDPAFFGIAPREAAGMDPQQRLLLETAWEALEDAGLPPGRLSGTDTGVFIGISTHDYLSRQLRGGDPGRVDAYAGTGNAFSAAAGRLSYFLGLRGPSLAVDTACSSSLVAVHLACRSLRSGECRVALAGGVNLVLSPEMTVAFSKAGMLAADGRCKTFDAAADGYVRAEGCGVVILRPLADAVAAGDPILAVISGSAVNQDGRSNGLTAPNGPAQEAVIRRALDDAGVPPSGIDYVETHGTGTSLGDPIEVRALGAVLCDGRRTPLPIGSVKTNVGHLEAAAGIASLIKTVLALRHGTIPPNLHFRTPNPYIPWDALPVTVPTGPLAWPRTDRPRRAGVSSFGFTGTNAHLIVEEAPAAPAATAPGRPVHLLALSAKDGQGLAELSGRYATYLGWAGEAPLADICFTATAGRETFACRRAVVGRTPEELIDALARPAAGEASPVPALRVAFLFTGQGSQYPGMGRRLYETEPVFRAAIDRCDSLLREWRDGSLRAVMHPDAGRATPLDETAWTQPALFALEYALAELFRAWGIVPAAVMGHSVGEFAAACVAGVFSLEDGLRLIAERGRLTQSLPAGGGMLAVTAAERVVRETIDGRPDVAIAALNAPEEVVLSGARRTLEALAGAFERQGIRTRPLTVSHAFHSPLMAPILDDFSRALAGTTFSRPRTAFVSNLTGRLVGAEITTAEYWRRHLLEPVRFAEGIETLEAAGCTHFVEIGPQPTLSALGMKSWRGRAATWIPALRQRTDDARQVLSALGALYEAGADVDWAACARGFAHRRINSLPTYPFQRERCWVDESPVIAGRTAAPPAEVHPILGRRLPDVAALRGATVWERDPGQGLPDAWRAYRIDGTAVLPVAAYIELALAAAREALGEATYDLSRLDVAGAQPVAADDATLQTVLTPLGPDEAACEIYVRAEETPAWVLAAGARVARVPARTAAPPRSGAGRGPVDLGIMFFNGSETPDQRQQYRLVIEAARFADRHGFSSVWVPERHYTAFGGLYPNPSVLQAALARETRRLRLMAGSIVLPLHHPLRAAEDWALVDNLSGGRVGLSLASGWNPDDFAMAPERYADRHEMVFRGLEVLRQLWRGEMVDAQSGSGRSIRIRTYPTPVQRELPVWVTAAGNPRTFARAGEAGAHLLTHLLDQDVEALAGKLAVYREARARAGHDPDTGRVTVMLHTFLGDEVDVVREQVRQPYCEYIKANIGLLKGLAFSRGSDIDLASLSPQDLDEFVGFLYDRFFSTRALLGTPDSTVGLVQALHEAGVDELACLIDFGPPADLVLDSLPHLARLHERVRGGPSRATVPAPRETVTHWQARCDQQMSGPVFYRRLRDRGVTFEEALQHVEQFWRRDGEALARLQPAGTPATTAATLDAALQAFMAALPAGAFTRTSDAIYVPSGADAVMFTGAPGPALWSHARLSRGSLAEDETFAGDVTLLNRDDEVVARVAGFQLRRTQARAARQAPGAGEILDTWLYDVRWEPKARGPVTPAVPPAEPETPDRPGRWLLLIDAGGVGAALADRLRARGDEVVEVRATGPAPGEPAAPADPANSDAIDPLAPAAFDRLLARATAGDVRLKGVVHLWSLDTVSPDALTADALRTAEEIGCGAAVHLVQAMAGSAVASRLWIVTRQAQAAGDGRADCAVAQAPVWGLGRVIAVEHPGLWGGLLDLPAPGAAGPDEELGWLEAELTEPDGEDQIAFRDGERRVARLLRAPKPGAAAVRFEPERLYLITGGLGGLGRRVANWLVRQGVTDLLLTGLHDLPAGAGATPIPPDAAPDVRERVAALQSLEAQGARVRYVRADASRVEEMRAVDEAIRADGRPLGGVIHLAGLPENRTIEEIDFARDRRVMAPKVSGAWILHELTRAWQPDFLICFSSISAVWGSRGQPLYAAANHFLDALTAHRRHLGLRTLTVNWGPWAEGGMVAPDDLRLLARMGLRALEPADGTFVLGRLLAAGLSQQVVASVDWPIFKDLFESRGRRPLLERVDAREAAAGDRTSASTELARALAAVGGEERRRQLVAHLQQQVAAVLALPGGRLPDPRGGFFEMGMDSLMALELKKRLQADFGVELRATAVFNYPTVQALADFLAGLLGAASTAAPTAPAGPATATIAADSDRLSDAELVRLLDEQLEAIDTPGEHG
ncbi:MAG TPA: MupA/Atu3671 family FMN-dependent luciferase-like monooxygenase [Vicinamibacterales bacterium]|nr:MupA/Atu3671 family FMN-dependent luciferase-like monooxygenase [Vicinamibacterales bacterium]